MTDMMVLFGPPGTGKTTRLTQLMHHYASHEGADTLLATSFTKAAAREMAGRHLPIDEHRLGTMHSLCYRALDTPPIAETLTGKGWNTQYPYWMIAPQNATYDIHTGTHDDTTPRDAMGERLLDTYNLWRNLTCAQGHIPDGCADFARKWEDFKHQMGAIDYTDMLLHALRLMPIAPGAPMTIIGDEAQDFTPLQWRLLLQWGKHARRLIMAGDDDQALYTWAGADPGQLLRFGEHEKIVLHQSYRIPGKVYTYVQRYLQAISQRQAKTWYPREVPGACHIAVRWLEQARETVQETLAFSHQTCAIIAPCSYMLEPMLKWLRHEGVPFANPWRTSRGDWNPLRVPARGMAFHTRLLDFLRPMTRLWTWQELSTWLPLIRKRGTLTSAATSMLLEHGEAKREVTRIELDRLFLPGAAHGALAGSLEWLRTHLLASITTAHVGYILRVFERYGRQGLSETPRIFVGTCHSVKGAEADTVVLLTALSPLQYQARSTGGTERDTIERMLYVGATRAKERLWIADGI